MIAALRRHPGVLLGAAVCGALTIAIIAPLARSGTLLLLDYGTYPAGPQPQLDSSVWGFPPGLVTRAPVDVLLNTVFHAVAWGWLRLLPFVLIAPLAWIGFRRLLGQKYLAVAAATTLFVINPWTDDRMAAGQVYLMVGYSLLPLLASMLLARPARTVAHAVLTGLLVTALIALAPHFIFIAGLLIVVALCVSLAARDWSRARAIAGSLGVAAALSLYWLIPAVVYHPSALPVTNADLAAFQTTADPRFGLGLNVLGLYGFWRVGAPLAKDFISGWPLLLLAMLILIAVGGVSAWRHLHSRVLVLTLGITAIIAIVLAVGDQGPTAGIFALLYDHVPGFAIMREPEKFSALLALAYATGFGFGVTFVYGFVRRHLQRVAVIGVAVLVPCVYGFTTFWGFHAYAAPSSYPSSWVQANRLMGNGAQATLALPWHLYLDFPWTQGRTVVNPMASYFQRPVISGDNIEAGDIETESTDARSSYLEYLFSVGTETTHLGRLLAPLGIRYVLLAKTDDWKDYGFLSTQSDLRVVHDWGDLTLFENTEPAPLAVAPASELTVDTWGDVVGLAQEAALTDYYLVVRNPGPGPIRAPDISPPAPPASVVTAQAQSPVQVTMRTPVNPSRLVVAEPFDPGWSVDGHPASEELGALTGFTNLPVGSISAHYGRWPVVRDSYIASGAIMLCLLAFAAAPGYRRRREQSTATPASAVINLAGEGLREPATHQPRR